MVSWRRPPTFMPCTPWSQPAMTWPTPSWNCSGAPRFQRRVELLAGGEGHAHVVDGDGVARLGDRAVALPDVLDLQVGRGLAAREVDLGLLDAHV